MQVQEVIDRIKEEIYTIVSSYIQLTPNGNKYKGSCPFHDEKTSSFFVTPSRGMYKCFGCGEGGDAIRFIEKFERVDFKEALERGAKKLNLDFKWAEQKDFNNEEYQHKESLRIVSDKAAQFFQEQLIGDSGARAYMEDVRGFAVTEDDLFRVGYAPKGNVLLAWAKKQGIKKNLLIDAGLIKVNEGREYDTFRDRIMFPICLKNGKVIAFTGRSLEWKKGDAFPKYLNTAETDIFIKGNELFGLNVAHSYISKEDRAYLVEGNTDVMRMHSVGAKNTIAPCGTALTIEQARVLKKLTNKVTLVYDGDTAGKKAVHKNAEILIKEQFYVSVIILPEGEDPDTLFLDKKVFEEYNDQQEDYIVYKVQENKSKAKNPVYKSELIKDTAFLISNYDTQSQQEVYIEFVSKIITPKKAWQDELKTLVAEKAPIEKKSYIPKHVNLEDYYKWGFYVDNNSYYFKDRKGEEFVEKSNFVLTPLFHIESTVNAKRLYEVRNAHGMVKVLEIPQRDMISIAAFKLRIESLGNFLWTGSEAEMNKIKAWLYEKTESCKEIVQMGWQRDGFFAWGNGIFNGKYTAVDKFGIVKHKDENYYIPAYSSIYKGEDTLFEFERKFIHIEGNITLREYTKKFAAVFGDNGRIAFCFTMASIFRDVVVSRFEKFPLLNMFGPKGAGKNACAESLIHLFGLRPKIPNLHNTSKAALADHVATSCNAVCVLDEYRNDLDMEKREFLKGLWDGTGRTRMNMDKDKKKETTKVEQGIIVCGQQMATADIALFSRFVTLSFVQTEYSDEEKRRFEELEEINKRGITHLTHQILRHREYVKEHLRSKVDAVAELFTTILSGEIIETRIFNNWLSIMALYATLNDELELPWNYEDTMRRAVDLMLIQNAEIKRSDDLGQFWKIVQFLIQSNMLYEGGDYKKSYTHIVSRLYRKNNTWTKDRIEWPVAKNVFWLTPSRVFSLYKQQCGREGGSPLPESTVEHYLRHSKAFLFDTKKESFKKIDPKTGEQEKKDGKNKRTSTSALVFDLDILEDIGAISLSKDEDDESGEVAPGTEAKKTPELPF